MKKYFLVETDEVCEFGDALHLVMFKELEDGKVTVEKDIEFSEDTMDWMIEMGFVQEREVEDEDKEPLIDFDDDIEPCETLKDLIEDFEELGDRVDGMETMIKEIYNIVSTLVKEEKKTASPKKK